MMRITFKNFARGVVGGSRKRVQIPGVEFGKKSLIYYVVAVGVIAEKETERERDIVKGRLKTAMIKYKRPRNFPPENNQPDRRKSRM